MLKYLKHLKIINESGNGPILILSIIFFAGSVLGELIIDPDTLDIQGKDVQF